MPTEVRVLKVSEQSKVMWWPHSQASPLGKRGMKPGRRVLEEVNRPGFTGEFLVQRLGCIFSSVQVCVECLLCFVRRDVADGAMQAGVVVPVDPFQGFPFDLTNGLPGSEGLDELGLEQADDAFGEGVVIGIPDAPDRGVDAGLGEPLGVSDRQVLAAAVAVVDQLVSLGRRPLADGLVQGLEDGNRSSSRSRRASRRSCGRRRR